MAAAAWSYRAEDPIRPALDQRESSLAELEACPGKIDHDALLQPHPAAILSLKESALEDQSTRHTFSIVSAPFQDDLVVATRMRDSAYKRALKSIAVGSQAASRN